jgi:hypothetical protein
MLMKHLMLLVLRKQTRLIGSFNGKSFKDDNVFVLGIQGP